MALLLDMEHQNNANRSPSSNVRMFQNKSVRTSQNKNAAMFLARFQSRSVRTSQSRFARKNQ